MTLDGSIVKAILSARATIKSQIQGKKSPMPVASTRKIEGLISKYNSLSEKDPLKKLLKKKIRAAELSRARDNAKESFR